MEFEEIKRASYNNDKTQPLKLSGKLPLGLGNSIRRETDAVSQINVNDNKFGALS
jgi:hypothetical protein